MRKELGFEVSDRIVVRYAADDAEPRVLDAHGESIAREVLAERFEPNGAGGESSRSPPAAPRGFEVRRA